MTRSPFAAGCFVVACWLAVGQYAQAVDIRLGNMEANRILFLGNSITFMYATPRWRLPAGAWPPVRRTRTTFMS